MKLHSPFKTVDERTDIAPPHPGEILREDILPHYKVTVAELARQTGVSLHTLTTVISEHAPVTRALAKRLGRTLGNGARYWIAVQLQYDLWHGSIAASHQAR
jgi:addiction module HigA family antidote